ILLFLFFCFIDVIFMIFFFFCSSRRRHTRYIGDWSSDVCSSDLGGGRAAPGPVGTGRTQSAPPPAVRPPPRLWPCSAARLALAPTGLEFEGRTSSSERPRLPELTVEFSYQ